MVKTPVPPRRPKVVDVSSILSDEEKAAIRARAAEHVEKERRKDADDQFFQQAIAEERRKDDPEEQMVYITLDMAGHAPYIMLDGVYYHHAETKFVSMSVYRTMIEIVARGWDHENEIGGANRDHYTRPRNVRLSPGAENVSSRALLSGRQI